MTDVDRITQDELNELHNVNVKLQALQDQIDKLKERSGFKLLEKRQKSLTTILLPKVAAHPFRTVTAGNFTAQVIDKPSRASVAWKEEFIKLNGSRLADELLSQAQLFAEKNPKPELIIYSR